MQISETEWYIWVIATVLTGAIGYFHCRQVERNQLSNMRNDGLTERAIESILGKERYLKITRS